MGTATVKGTGRVMGIGKGKGSGKDTGSVMGIWVVWLLRVV